MGVARGLRGVFGVDFGDARGVCVDVAFAGINCAAALLYVDQPYSIDVAVGPFSGLWGTAPRRGWGVTRRTLRACTISLPVKDLAFFASLWLVGELS